MNTIKVDGTGPIEQRVGSLEQAVNYGEVVLPFTIVGDTENTGGGEPGPPGPPGPTGPQGPQGEPGTGGGGASVHVGATPPAAPAVGDLWWRNDPDGTLFVSYDDGNSQQWVPATPTIKGDPGPAGTGVMAYRHVQTAAATTWTITHGLSFMPNVTAVDSTGRAIWPGALDYVSATAVQLTFSAAVGGEAYLS